MHRHIQHNSWSNLMKRRRGVLTILWFVAVAARFELASASDAAPGSSLKTAQPGQIIIDPQHPQWLKRNAGGHVFICGPGDPEEFLYLGTRNPDGTRDGDQVQRI